VHIGLALCLRRAYIRGRQDGDACMRSLACITGSMEPSKGSAHRIWKPRIAV